MATKTLGLTGYNVTISVCMPVYADSGEIARREAVALLQRTVPAQMTVKSATAVEVPSSVR